MTSKKLHIDSDNIQRGFYVYVHRERESREVFYVGKGQGKRAWDKTARNAVWKEKTRALGDAWDVEIVRDGLSEPEAFDLEEALVKENGGPACLGGRLTNWFPGGESPGSVSFDLVSLLHENTVERLEIWQRVYEAARVFRPLPIEQQKLYAESLRFECEWIMERSTELLEYAEKRGDAELGKGLFGLDYIVHQVFQQADEFLCHREPWKDILFQMEDLLDDVDQAFIDVRHEKAKPLARKAVRCVKAMLDVVDSGNREEAERVADETVGQDK